MDRFIRLKSLGKGYRDEDVNSRLAGQDYSIVGDNLAKYSRSVFIKPTPKKYKGFQGLVWHYMFLLGVVKKADKRVNNSDTFKKDILHFDKITTQFKVLTKYSITDYDSLEISKEKVIFNMQALMEQRKSIPAPNRGLVNLKISDLRKDLKAMELLNETIPKIQKITQKEKPKSTTKDDLLRSLRSR